MREVVNTTAVVNWYKLLWQCVTAAIQPVAGLEKLERELAFILHHYARDDTAIVIGLMKVWALARILVFGGNYSISKTAFSAIDEKTPDLENAIAFLCGPPVDRVFIDANYRLPPPLGMLGVELNDEGILHLYSIWHLAILEKVIAGGIDVVSACTPDFNSNTTLLDDDYRRLDRMLGLEYVPFVKTFSSASNINPFTMIKRAGLDPDLQSVAAGLLFDHDPVLYPMSLHGKYLLLAKTYSIPLLILDEALFSKPSPAIWLVYTSTHRFAAILDGEHLLMFPFDQFNALAAMLEQLSRDRGGGEVAGR